MRRTALVVRALAVERALSLLDKFIDASMILALILWGPIGCFIVGLVLSLVFCLCVLEGEIRTGFTGIDHLKRWATDLADEDLSWFERMLKPLLRRAFRSHWGMLLVGSVIHLESDYVTLILRRPSEGRLSTIVRVMLPSVAWSILIWTLIYWGSLEGLHWLWLELTGCEPTACLQKPEWQGIREILLAIGDVYQGTLERLT